MVRFLAVLGVLLAVLAPSARAAPAALGQFMQSNQTAAGRWITANHNAVVQIAPCGPDLCGRIVGIVLAPGEPVPKDWKGDSQCGLTIIRTAPVAGSNGTLWDGSVLDPRDGSVYNAQIRLNANHDLLLRGYLGLPIFGQTQTWTAYPGRPATDCRLAAG